MRGNPEKFLEYEYRKNPLVKHFLDNIAIIDEDEIKSSKLIKWIREYLCDLKKALNYDDSDLIERGFTKFTNSKYAKKIIYIKEGVNPDFSGKIIRWVGEKTFIFFNKSEILVETDDLLFVTGKGIWNNTIFSSTIDQRLNKCVMVKNSTFSEYKRYIQFTMQLRHGISGQYESVPQHDLLARITRNS